MTNSRERVIQTLECDQPDRIPRDLWTLPWAHTHFPAAIEHIRQEFPMDISSAPGYLKEQPNTQGDPYEIGTSVDEWGCERLSIHPGIIGEIKKPLIQDLKKDLDKVRPPRELLTITPEKVNQFYAGTDQFVMGGCCANPFERMQYLRGSQNLYYDIAEQPQEFFLLRDRVHTFFMELLETWCRTDVDAINLMDDWGAQEKLLISPRMWRQLYKPLYQEYCDLIHSYGKYVFMHSDGHITAIYPDLIEIGVNAINSQLFIMDIEALGAAYGGKITFWGEMDRQHLLAHGTVDEIHQAVRRVHEHCYHNGGVIAQCEFGPGAKPELVHAVYEAWNDV
jgi:uroporphyrinogen decarboxylase